MYEIIVNVIQSGRFALEELLRKIDTLWIQGQLTEGQYQALIHQARSCALPENTYAPLHAQLTALAQRVAALEKQAAAAPVPDVQWPEFVQPTGAHDAYHTGDRVCFAGKFYVCSAPEEVAVVWSPAVYPDYWQEVEVQAP